jgi:hypothetical protein
MKLRHTEIKDTEDDGTFNFYETEDFEFVNPIEQISSIYIISVIELERNILKLKNFEGSEETIQKVLMKRALSDWNKRYIEIISTTIPVNLIELLNVNTKRGQIKLLKGLSLNTSQLMAFVFLAFEKFGYKFSQYKAQHHHNGLNIDYLPKLIYIEENGNIKTIGKTPLTKGQQLQAVEHRKVTISKFLDNDQGWHCFFLTFKSLSGKENYKNGQPHLHYISDKWGIDREEVKSQLTSKDYRLPSLPHIDFHTYRDKK